MTNPTAIDRLNRAEKCLTEALQLLKTAFIAEPDAATEQEFSEKMTAIRRLIEELDGEYVW